MDEIKTKLRTFLATKGKGQDVADDADLFATGFVTSMVAMELVIFIEQTFEITIENEELDLENFRSINRMAELIYQKGTPTTPGGGHT